MIGRDTPVSRPLAGVSRVARYTDIGELLNPVVLSDGERDLVIPGGVELLSGETEVRIDRGLALLSTVAVVDGERRMLLAWGSPSLAAEDGGLRFTPFLIQSRTGSAADLAQRWSTRLGPASKGEGAPTYAQVVDYRQDIKDGYAMLAARFDRGGSGWSLTWAEEVDNRTKGGIPGVSESDTTWDHAHAGALRTLADGTLVAVLSVGDTEESALVSYRRIADGFWYGPFVHQGAGRTLWSQPIGFMEAAGERSMWTLADEASPAARLTLPPSMGLFDFISESDVFHCSLTTDSRLQFNGFGARGSCPNPEADEPMWLVGMLADTSPTYFDRAYGRLLWSPDGRVVGFAGVPGNAEIGLLSLEGPEGAGLSADGRLAFWDGGMNSPAYAGLIDRPVIARPLRTSNEAVNHAIGWRNMDPSQVPSPFILGVSFDSLGASLAAQVSNPAPDRPILTMRTDPAFEGEGMQKGVALRIAEGVPASPTAYVRGHFWLEPRSGELPLVDGYAGVDLISTWNDRNFSVVPVSAPTVFGEWVPFFIEIPGETSRDNNTLQAEFRIAAPGEPGHQLELSIVIESVTTTPAVGIGGRFDASDVHVGPFTTTPGVPFAVGAMLRIPADGWDYSVRAAPDLIRLTGGGELSVRIEETRLGSQYYEDSAKVSVSFSDGASGWRQRVALPHKFIRQDPITLLLRTTAEGDVQLGVSVGGAPWAFTVLDLPSGAIDGFAPGTAVLGSGADVFGVAVVEDASGFAPFTEDDGLALRDRLYP